MLIPAARALPSLFLLGLFPVLVEAQEEYPLTLALDSLEGTVTLEVGDVLGDPGLQNALHSGLPLRIRIFTELWDDGFFDSHEGTYEWRASILYDPVSLRYRVQTMAPVEQDLILNTLPEAGEAVQLTLPIPLSPTREGRFYYLVKVEVETLSLSDLEELQRWLRGDLAPVVSGDQDVESAVGRGFRRLFVRLLALPARRFQLRTETFQFQLG